MPKLLTTPFAAESQLRTNIQESQGAESNSATYRLGFPEETMKKIALGGKPPKGEDMNGILYDLSENIVFQTQGGRYKFDPTYANKIGGYPVNAILQLENGSEVLNKTPNNVTNPNVDMTGWASAGGGIKVVESIADMLAIKNPKDGDVAFCKSYHAGRGEGGDYFFYKNTQQLENDGISVFSGWVRQKRGRPWTPEDAGCIRDGTDDAPYFLKLFNLAKKHALCVSFKESATYTLDSDVTVEDVHSITILANNATLNITNSSRRDWVGVLTLLGIPNSAIFIDDIEFNGEALFHEQTVGRENWMIQCLRLLNMHVYIRGMTQTKCIGTLNNFLNCPSATVDGYTGTLVGGNNSSTGGDSLGDVFYIGERNGSTSYSFHNITATGVIEEGLASRAFIVVEILYPDKWRDTGTLVDVKNVTAHNFMRTLHTETAHDDVSFTVDNSVFSGVGVFALSVGAPDTRVTCTNTQVSFDTQGYAGTHTLNWGCTVTMGDGCNIDASNVSVALIHNSAPPLRTLITDGAVVDNIRGLLASNGNVLVSNKATLRFDPAYTRHYMWDSKITCDNAVLECIATGVIHRMSREQNNFRLSSCIVRGLDFHNSCYLQSPSSLHLTTTSAGYKPRMFESRLVDAYADDVCIRKIGQTLEVQHVVGVSSADQLYLAGRYAVEGGLANMPAGFSVGVVETIELFSHDEYRSALIQVATSFPEMKTSKRTRDYRGEWSVWV